MPLNLHISGANVVADVTRKPGERIVSIMVGGAPLDHKAYYSIAAPDFFLRGGATAIRNSPKRRYVRASKMRNSSPTM